jgi:hypothetical protein
VTVIWIELSGIRNRSGIEESSDARRADPSTAEGPPTRLPGVAQGDATYPTFVARTLTRERLWDLLRRAQGVVRLERSLMELRVRLELVCDLYPSRDW